MVKGFNIKCSDIITITQLKAAFSNLPLEMEYKIISTNPLEANVIPKSERVKLAMYKDKLEGIKAKSIRENYLNTFTPFLKKYVRNINKVEVSVYD